MTTYYNTLWRTILLCIIIIVIITRTHNILRVLAVMRRGKSNKNCDLWRGCTPTNASSSKLSSCNCTQHFHRFFVSARELKSADTLRKFGYFHYWFREFSNRLWSSFHRKEKKKHDRKIDALDPFPGQHLCVGLGTVKAVSANRDPKTTQKHEKHHPNAQKNIKNMHNYYDRFKAIGYKHFKSI